MNQFQLLVTLVLVFTTSASVRQDRQQHWKNSWDHEDTLWKQNEPEPQKMRLPQLLLPPVLAQYPQHVLPQMQPYKVSVRVKEQEDFGDTRWEQHETLSNFVKVSHPQAVPELAQYPQHFSRMQSYSRPIRVEDHDDRGDAKWENYDTKIYLEKVPRSRAVPVQAPNPHHVSRLQFYNLPVRVEDHGDHRDGRWEQHEAKSHLVKVPQPQAVAAPIQYPQLVSRLQSYNRPIKVQDYGDHRDDRWEQHETKSHLVKVPSPLLAQYSHPVHLMHPYTLSKSVEEQDDQSEGSWEQEDVETQLVKIPQPQAVPVPARYPQPILQPQPYPVPVNVEEPVVVPTEEVRLYPVVRNVPYIVHKPVPTPVVVNVPFPVERHFVVPEYKPFPVKVPVIKYIHHYQHGGKNIKKRRRKSKKKVSHH